MAKKSSSSTILAAIATAIIIASGLYYATSLNAQDVEQETAPSQDLMRDSSLSKTSTEKPTITADYIFSQRSIGSADAPVTIREHSSLTCSHCGAFHKNTYKQLKKEFIDTGKARLIFEDFPLNAPAADATLAARCLPQERYFDFLQLLFETQDKWAYSSDYRKYLKQNAQLAGLSSDDFDACVDNEDYKAQLLGTLKAIQEKSNIRSTPSFVVNDGTVLTGAQPIEAFRAIIEKELAK